MSSGEWMNLIRKFSLDCEIRGFHPGTVSTYTAHVNDFMTRVQDYKSVSTDELRHHLVHLRQRNYKSSTYNSYYCALETFFDFLILEGECNDNPIPAFRKRYLKRVTDVRDHESRQCPSLPDIRILTRSA